jgi:hypothetical protein
MWVGQKAGLMEKFASLVARFPARPIPLSAALRPKTPSNDYQTSLMFIKKSQYAFHKHIASKTSLLRF